MRTPSLPFRLLLIWFGLPLALATFAFEPFGTVLFIVIMSSPARGSASAAIAVQTAYVCSLFFIAAQATLLSLCLACSPGKLWPRLTLYGCVFGACVGCWLLGSLVSPSIFEWYAKDNPQLSVWAGASSVFPREATWNSLRLIVSMSPTILLGFQLPFWIMRVMVGWRLIHPYQAVDQLSATGKQLPETLSIKDLLAATTFVALCLGLLQIAGMGDEGDAPAAPQSAYFIGAVLAAAGFAIFVFMGVIPLTILFLRRYSRFWSWVVTLVIAAAASLVILLLDRLQQSATDWRLFLSFVTSVYAYFITLASALQMLNAYGWRLAKCTA